MSELARVEVPAALWRKRRVGAFAPEQARVLCDAFEDDWYSGGRRSEPFTVVPVTPDILDDAARHIELHGLRASDALQVATAVAARAADPDVTAFGCFDASLNRVARREGFDVLAGSAGT